MKKSKLIILILVLVLIIPLLINTAGLSQALDTSVYDSNTNYYGTDTGCYIVGTIKLLDVEGGCYVIAADSGEYVQPDNLLTEYPEFAIDNLKIRYSYSSSNYQAGTCMSGNFIHLDCISKLSDSSSICKANFDYSIDSPIYFNDTIAVTVHFLNKSQGENIICIWNFGDSISSVEKNPSHTYYLSHEQAEFTVTFAISDDINNRDVISKSISFDYNSKKCKADFNYTIMSYTIPNSKGVDSISLYFFTDNSKGNINNWIWKFGDGTSWNTQNTSHVYNFKFGDTAWVTHIISGPDCTDSIVKPVVKIWYNPPVCKAVINYTWLTYISSTQFGFQFIDSSSGNPNEWHWDFGDGTISTEQNPIHKFINVKFGDSTWVSLRIGSANGCVDSIRELIIFYQNPPLNCKADFDYKIEYTPCTNPELCGTGVRPFVIFTDKSKGSNGDIINWEWYFGDGTYNNIQNPTHLYDLKYGDTAWVSLTSSTSDCSDNITKPVIINSKPVKCKANFIFNNDSTGDIYSYRFYDRSQGNIFSWYWVFPDGTTSTEQNPTHICSFLMDTASWVCLTVYGADSCVDTYCAQLNIAPHGLQIAGKVYTGHNPLESGIVIAYKKENRIYLPAGVAIIKSEGNYQIERLPIGQYIIYAIPNSTLTSNYFPTYFVDNLSWKKADVISLSSNIYGINIDLVKSYNISGGICRISGSIFFSNDSSNSVLKSSLSIMNIPVMLASFDGSELISTLAGNDGSFEFDNLYYGNYIVYPEIPSVENVVPYSVNLTSTQPNVDNIQFIVKNNEIITNAPGRVEDQEKIEFSYLPQYGVLKLKTYLKVNTNLQLLITNSLGQIIQIEKFYLNANSNELSIGVQDLPSGIYILRANTEKNQFKSFKFIK